MNVRRTSVPCRLTQPHPDRPHLSQGRRPRCSGFTLAELAIAFVVFGMILILLGATFPAATAAGHAGGNYAEASFLSQHKIDQIRNLGFAKMDGASLAAQGLIDTNSNGTPMTVPNPAGLPASTISYSFTLTDNLVDNTKNNVFYPGFFPAGSTGIVSIGDYHDLTAAHGSTNVVVPTAVLKSVTVTVVWAGNNQGNGALTTHTAISSL